VSSSKCQVSKKAWYFYAEMANMHLMFNRVYGTEYKACCKYQQHFPLCQSPERKTFSTLDRQLKENGTFNVQMTISNHSVKHFNKKAEILLSFLQIQRQAQEE
jgi:hypothetical protein